MTKPARKAGAKGASIPYEPRRRGVTRPAIQSLLLPSRSGPTSQAGRTLRMSRDEERVNSARMQSHRHRAPRHWLNPLFGIYSLWDLRPPCTEAEPPAILLDCQIREARRLQPPAKGIRIHRCIAVTQVDQSKEKGVHAVEPSEDTARAKHPPRFGEQAVLRRRRRNVMEHRKRDHAGKRTVGERHRRSIAVNNSYVRTLQPLLQRVGRSGLYFQDR